MLLIRFSLHHLLRHARLNGASLLGLALACALIAGLPGYAVATAGSSLKDSLENATPAGRNLLITGEGYPLTAALDGYVKENLGDLFDTSLEVRTGIFSPEFPKPPVISVDGGERLKPDFVSAWSFSKMSQLLHLQQGKYPVFEDPPVNPRPDWIPQIEAIIDSTIAAQTGLVPGDILTTYAADFHIVGIFERFDPDSDLWWRDPSPFEVVRTPRTNDDLITIPVIVNPGSFRYLLPFTANWRVLLHTDRINVNNAQVTEQGLLNLKTRLNAKHAVLTSGLIDLMEEYRMNLATVRMALFLLTAQAFLFVLYTLILISSLLIERSSGELATMAGRGANSLQITLAFALQSLVLAVIAGFLLGPSLAWVALKTWARLSGEVIPQVLPLESWLLSLAAAGVGWLTLAVPVFPAARRSVLEWQRRLARPSTTAGWQRLYLDFFLLALGGLAYWQLSTSGSFVLNSIDRTSFADPVLLLSPSLLLIAVALLFLRILPYILRLFAWLTRPARGLVLPLGLSRLSRDPVRPSQVILLISLTAALTFFSQSFSDSLLESQREIALYRSGADLRLAYHQLPKEWITGLPGILAKSTVLRLKFQEDNNKFITALGIDPASFPQIARYPAGLTNLSMVTLAQALRWESSTQVEETQGEFVANPYLREQNPDFIIPAIFSYAALPRNGKIGDKVNFTFSGYHFVLEVRGIIADFPTVSGAYLVVDSNALEDHIQIADPRFDPNREIWLLLSDEGYANIESLQDLQPALLSDSRQELIQIQTDALTRGATRAFALNALILAVLSISGFLLVNYFAARSRSYEFSILRAEGLSGGQVARLLASEGALLIFLGLSAGSALGYLLVLIMRPYLSRALAGALPGMAVRQVSLNWPAISGLYALLLTFYALALLMLLLALLRLGIHRLLRIGDE